MKLIITSAILLLCSILPFVLTPESLQIVLAGQAKCEFSEEQSGDVGTQFWEIPLANLFRYKQWYLGSSEIIEDSLVDKTTPLHILLIAYEEYDGVCKGSASSLFERYLERGSNANVLSSYGLLYCTKLF